MKKMLPILLLLPLAGCGLFDSGHDELTSVEGTVREKDTQRPVAGVLIDLRSCHHTTLGWSCIYQDDTVRTDANGHYRFQFRTARKRAYRVEVNDHRHESPYLLYMPDDEDNSDYSNLLREGQANTVDFRVVRNTVLRIRLINRNVGRRFMQFNGTVLTRASTIDTTIFQYRQIRNQPLRLEALFFNRNAAGNWTDTLTIRKTVAVGPNDTTTVSFGLIR